MSYEMEKIIQSEPNWRVAGEWIVAESDSNNIVDIDIPAFVIWANRAYRSLSTQGVGDELPASMVGWLKTQMDKTEVFEHSYVHPIFDKVFPIRTLPETITPNWQPWTVIETFDPNKIIVVQPLILSPIVTPRVMVSRKINATTYVPPKVDPFIMASVDMAQMNFGWGMPVLPRVEAGHMRLVISSFWKNIFEAGCISGKVNAAPIRSSSREAALETKSVMNQAGRALTDLAKRLSLYVISLDQPGNPFPLSPVSRGVIMIPWLIKAAEAWMEPIRVLAGAGRVELPQG